jgi:hypothetical protein
VPGPLHAEKILSAVWCRDCSRLLPQIWCGLECVRLHRRSLIFIRCVVRTIIHASGCLAEARRLLLRALEGFGGGRSGVQHGDGAGRLHGKWQYLSHGVCRGCRTERTRVVVMDIECRAWRSRRYLYYLDRPAVSDGVRRCK